MSATATAIIIVTHLATQPSTPPWCDALKTRLHGLDPASSAPSYEAYAAAVAHVPSSAASVVEAARLAIEEAGEVAAGMAVLRELVRLGCVNPLVEDATVLRDKVRSLEAGDARFVGTREGPDFVERLLERARALLMELLESELMQRYAGLSRAVYLVGLALVVSLWSLRLYRARRPRRQRHGEREHAEVVARGKALDAQRLLEEAQDAWREGQLRRCLRAVHLALLVDATVRNLGTFPVAATDRELLSLLPSSLQRRLGPLTTRLQAALYSRATPAPVEVEGFMQDANDFLARREERP